jgi:DNA-directed RNA polymerase specialized sigma24 family protein
MTASDAPDAADAADAGSQPQHAFPEAEFAILRRRELLGDWAAPLDSDGRLGPAALAELRREAHIVHRQLTPIWRRKTNHSRLLLLDTPLGDGLTLHDLLAEAPHPGGPGTTSDIEDDRLRLVLAGLDAAEQAVVLALAHPGVTTWSEAAAFAGTTEAFGERVRRKVRRLVRRLQPADVTGAER